MTDFARFRERTRDMQDHVERGLWGNLQYKEGAGASLSVRGTGTLDEEVPLMNLGYGFNLPANSQAEMIMLSLGSDWYDKVALATLPRNLQYQWAEGTGGVQHPLDPERRLQFDENGLWLKDGVYRAGNNEEVKITVADGGLVIESALGASITIDGDSQITISGGASLRVAGTYSVEAESIRLESNSLTHNGVNIGANHRHSGVRSGISISGEPV